MRFKVNVTILSLVFLASSWPALAHHSFAAEYDADKPVQVTGLVTKVEWTNPHARFYVDVKDDQGNVENWNIELGPPLILKRLGWRHDSLKIGDQVTVAGFSAKDGSKMANAKKVTLADGTSVFAGSQAESKPAQ
ncbi:MAG TPA: DUF6152 family protein [Bryobacteraceae bacterium]|nr:DUF6152 family protein [Bryobacteraceae bacterium]